MPASSATSSRLVAANPLRANARVAAARICSRRSARGSRSTGSALVLIRPPLIDSEVYYSLCLCQRVLPEVYKSTDHHGAGRGPAVRTRTALEFYAEVSGLISKMHECQRLVPHNYVAGHIDNNSWQAVSREMGLGS